MNIQRENYRRFELERLLWAGGETPEPATVEAPKATEQNEKASEAEVKSPEQKAQEAEASVRGEVDQMKDAAPSPEAEQLAQETERKVNQRVKDAEDQHTQETAQSQAPVNEAAAKADNLAGKLESGDPEGGTTTEEEAAVAEGRPRVEMTQVPVEAQETNEQASPTPDKVIEKMIEHMWNTDKLRGIASKLVGKADNMEDFAKKMKEDSSMMEGLKKSIAKLSPQTMEKLEKGAAVFTKEELKQLGQAMKESFGVEKLDDVDKKEIDLINTLKLGGTTPEKYLGKGFVRILSMRNKIEAAKDGEGIVITPRSGGEATTIKADEGRLLISSKYIPKEYREQYDAYIKTSKENPQEARKELESLRKSLEKGADQAEAAKDLAELLEDPSKLKDAEKTGPLQILATIIQLVKMFQSGDMNTFQEAMDVLKEEGIEGFSDALKKGPEYYKNTIAEKKIDNYDDLLTMYAEPGGDLAKGYFPDGKFTSQLKPVIIEHMKAKMGIGIDDIKVVAKGNYVIRQVEGNKLYDISMKQGASGFSVSMDRISIVDGSEKVAEKGEAVAMGKSDLQLDDLSAVIAKGPQAAEAPSAPPTEPETTVAEAGAVPPASDSSSAPQNPPS